MMMWGTTSPSAKLTYDSGSASEAPLIGDCRLFRGAIGWSRMPIARIRCKKTGPYKVSRSRRVVPRERLGDLARDPLRGWVCRHAKRHPKSSSVAHNDKTIQNLECDRRQDKEVDRRDAVGVIAENRRPALRRWPRVAAHVPGDRRLGDLEAELEQLTMNTRCAPKCVRTAHLANERAQLSRGVCTENLSPGVVVVKPANDGV
jgi:hypothetical protein